MSRDCPLNRAVAALSCKFILSNNDEEEEEEVVVVVVVVVEVDGDLLPQHRTAAGLTRGQLAD